MSPVARIVTLQKNLKKQNAETNVYFTAKEMGVRWFRNMYDYFKISAEDVIKWGINVLAIAGWGETQTPLIDVNKKFYTVLLNGGAEAKVFGRVGYAVDHFVRGCYASGAMVLFGVECDCVELRCTAEGNPFC